MRLDEVGWQVAVPRSRLGAYFGAETVVPTTEASQASIYAALVRYEACDPSVDALLFLGLRDEPNLSRWQAGLMRADGSPRPSYRSVQTVLSETGGNCVGKMRTWRHSTAVDGAAATFPSDRRLPRRIRSWGFTATAAEDARLRAGVYRLRKGRRPVRVLSERGRIEAHVTRSVRFPSWQSRAGPVRLLDPPQSRSEPGPRDPRDEPSLRRHSLIEPCPVPGPGHVVLRQRGVAGRVVIARGDDIRGRTGFARAAVLSPDRPAALPAPG